MLTSPIDKLISEQKIIRMKLTTKVLLLVLLNLTVTQTNAQFLGSLDFNGDDNYVEIINSTKKVRLSITNVASELILSKIFNDSIINIDLSDYPIGVYFLQIHSEGHVISHKVIKP